MTNSIYKRKKTLIYNYIKEVFWSCPISKEDAKTGSTYISIGNNKTIRIADHPKKDYEYTQILINPFNNYYTLVTKEMIIPLTFNQLKLMLYQNISDGLNTIGGMLTKENIRNVQEEESEQIKELFDIVDETSYVSSPECTNFLYYITHEQYLRLNESGKKVLNGYLKGKKHKNAKLIYLTKNQYKSLNQYF